MGAKAVIRLLKGGNRLVVDSTAPDIIRMLQQELQYDSVRMLYGAEKQRLGVGMLTETFRCYAMDIKGRVATSFGLYARISDRLRDMGYEVEIVDVNPHPRPEVFEPQWDRLYDPSVGITLRYRQEEFLLHMLTSPCGRFDCVPAFGKTKLVGCLALLLPFAKIHITSKRVAVLRGRMYPELCGMLPDVGICGGGLHSVNHRVQLFTADSLHHSDGHADILIIDESHEFAAEKAATSVAKYEDARVFGLSATHDMRMDNKDMRVEAICGPVLMTVTYPEAVAHGLVVPLRVVWHQVNNGINPCNAAGDDKVKRKRLGIWRHVTRNRKIAEVARQYDDTTQVLITCETVEHAMALKKELPEFTVVHAENAITDYDRSYYARQGIWPPAHPTMTADRRWELTRAFENGSLKKVIVTTVWNVGVSFDALEVLIRAEAGGSAIMDTQIPGRASRLFDDKSCGTIHDFVDNWDGGFKNRSGARRNNYAKHGWTQTYADDKQKTPPAQAPLFSQEDA